MVKKASKTLRATPMAGSRHTRRPLTAGLRRPWRRPSNARTDLWNLCGKPLEHVDRLFSEPSVPACERNTPATSVQRSLKRPARCCKACAGAPYPWLWICARGSAQCGTCCAQGAGGGFCVVVSCRTIAQVKNAVRQHQRRPIRICKLLNDNDNDNANGFVD